ncbi:trans-aconitate 2-methyltransferase [Parasphingorhabdus pacifica]
MWNPETYLAFSDHRVRPAHDLLARVGASSARRVVDLGCGAGNLTSLLTGRWPEATVEATDSSPEMVKAARSRGVDARLEDVRDWRPLPDTDVVLCNAVLQWIPEHLDLIRDWLPQLPHGAWFAFQVPGNYAAPSHALVRELVAEPEWQDLAEAVHGPDVVPDPLVYADVLADLGATADVWETTYVQRLSGEDPVLDWISGTALRPLRSVLDEDRWQRFRGQLAPRLRSAYPQRSDGTTWFPFRRIFVVAHRG